MFWAPALLLYYLITDSGDTADGGGGDSGESSAPTSASDYIKRYSQFANNTQQYYGVPATFTLAQGGLESGWGASNIARRTNNHFGIKADRSWSGPAYNGWRVYDSVQDSFDDHGKFLVQNPRYDNAFSTSDPYEFAQYVAAAGYDENPSNYVQLITKVIDSVKRLL